jgi:hypothetical protein
MNRKIIGQPYPSDTAGLSVWRTCGLYDGGISGGRLKKGIEPESVELAIKGNLNLRGFLNIDAKAPVGFDHIEFHFDVKGSGTPADYAKIIREVQ